MIGILPTKAALAVNVKQPFAGTGGTPPYAYAVLPGGAGGIVDPGTGLYTAPPTINDNPLLNFDTIRVTDSLAATSTAIVFVGSALELLCDIIQNELGLAQGRVYVWDQKIKQPTDSALFVVARVLMCKAFSNINEVDGATGDQVQSTNFYSQISLDIKSRGPDAKNRKEEVVLALNSYYAKSQQELNSFKIGRIPSSILNFSEEDGAAIPYRFNITVGLQYMVSKTTASPFFDDFETTGVTTEP